MTGTFQSTHPENENHLFARYSSVYILLVGLILFLAVLSRFVILGDRVMSHDEVNHVVPAYALYQGRAQPGHAWTAAVSPLGSDLLLAWR